MEGIVSPVQPLRINEQGAPLPKGPVYSFGGTPNGRLPGVQNALIAP